MRIDANAVRPAAGPEPARPREAAARPPGANGGGAEAPAPGKVLPAGAGETAGPAGDAPAAEDAVRRIQSYVQSVRRELRFSVDDATGRMVIKVLDPETDEVIRQIPPEEIIAIARALSESPERVAGGLLFRARA